MTYALLYSFLKVNLVGKNSYAMEAEIRKRRQKEIYDKKIFREKGHKLCRFGSGSCCRCGVWVCLYLPLWGSTEDGGNCVRKDGGQYTFEWLCADKYGTITLAQSDNIKNCYTCFLKKFSDWTWEQEKRLGIREDQNI